MQMFVDEQLVRLTTTANVTIYLSPIGNLNRKKKYMNSYILEIHPDINFEIIYCLLNVDTFFLLRWDEVVIMWSSKNNDKQLVFRSPKN